MASNGPYGQGSLRPVVRASFLLTSRQGGNVVVRLARKKPAPRCQFEPGFTLVELLVVITIVGILVALLLPAVQAAREAARQVQCKNNLKQVAAACLHHEQLLGFLPTAGWSYSWVGDPDQGFTQRQPGGWQFNILPFLEQQALRDLGLNNNQIGRTQTAATALQVFICPTRRKVAAYTDAYAGGHVNWNKGATIGRSDYAGNAGEGCDLCTIEGPLSLSDGDSWTTAQWYAVQGTDSLQPLGVNGVFFRHGVCRLAAITDGTSNTYLAGEKSVEPDYYETGQDWGDDQCWSIGYDYDTVRWTNPTAPDAPAQDMPGVMKYQAFGSAHSVGFHTAMCDGSVRMMNYSINPDVHRRLGNRHDGLPIDGKQW
jgi:prepilin-type N-terminal cleavage/methylation domain-containing protein